MNLFQKKLYLFYRVIFKKTFSFILPKNCFPKDKLIKTYLVDIANVCRFLAKQLTL